MGHLLENIRPWSVSNSGNKFNHKKFPIRFVLHNFPSAGIGLIHIFITFFFPIFTSSPSLPAQSMRKLSRSPEVPDQQPSSPLFKNHCLKCLLKNLEHLHQNCSHYALSLSGFLQSLPKWNVLHNYLDVKKSVYCLCFRVVLSFMATLQYRKLNSHCRQIWTSLELSIKFLRALA